MSYQVYDTRGFVCDLASNGGMRDLMAYLIQQDDADVKRLGKDGEIEITPEVIAKLEAIASPADSTIQSTLKILKGAAKQCRDILIISDGMTIDDNKTVKGLFQDDVAKEAFWKSYVQRVEAYEAPIISNLKEVFRNQKQEALQNVNRATSPAYELISTLAFRDDYTLAVEPTLTTLILDSVKHGMDLIPPKNPHKAGPIPAVVSHAALLWLKTRIGWAAAQVGEETAKLLANALAEGFAAGESMIQIAERVSAIFEMSDMRAMKIARTEVISASAQGALEGYQEAGVQKSEFYTAMDERMCDDCDALHGEVFALNDATPMIPLHPNCLLPDVRVNASHVIAASRAFYRGKAVEITTEDGDGLTITPNHMVLTPTGFVESHALRERDYIIRSLASERIVTSIDPYHDHAPAPIEDVWNALVMQQGMVITSMPVAAEDFHGDARGFEGDINIVHPDSFLLSGIKNAFVFKHINHKTLNSRSSDTSSLSSVSSHSAFGDRPMSTPCGYMRSGAKCLTLCRTHSRKSQKIGLAPSSRLNTSIGKALPNNSARYIELSRQFQLRFASLIAPKQIVKIREVDYVGHVYDLQSLERLYIANNIVVKNCRCTWLPVID